MKEFSFNINNIIKVRLTDMGKDILNEYFSELNKCCASLDFDYTLAQYAEEYAEDTDGYRFCLGNIVVRNLQKIPYKHTDGQWERVVYPKLKVFLTYNSENGAPSYAGYIYVNDSFAKKVSVEIPNGEDDISFKLYIDC